MAVIFYGPVSVTHRHRLSSSGREDMVTTTQWIGPFGSPRSGDFVGTYSSIKLVKSSIDFSRLIIVLFAVNFIPVLLLWQVSRQNE